MVDLHSTSMPWSSFIRAVGAKRHLRALPAERSNATGQTEPEQANRTLMGINVSPVHGHHCICNRCAMLTERIRVRNAA